MTEALKSEIENKLLTYRKKKATNIICSFVLGAVFLGIGIIVAYSYAMPFFILFFAFFGFILGTILYGILNHFIRSNYKNEVLPIVLNHVFGGEVNYFPKSGFTLDFIKSLKFIPVTSYKGEDYIIGKFKNIEFSCCDVLMQHQVQTGKTTTTVTDFKGSLWVIDFHKDISNSRIDIYEKSCRYGKNTRGLEKIEFEDMEFNDEFKVYANDDHDAFYIITPQLIVKLKENLADLKGSVRYSIRHNKLIMAVEGSSQNMMEFSSDLTSVESIMEKVNDEFEPIALTIDLFNIKSEDTIEE